MVMARLKGVSGVGVFRRLQRAGLVGRSQEGRAEEGTQIGSEQRCLGSTCLLCSWPQNHSAGMGWKEQKAGTLRCLS